MKKVLLSAMLLVGGVAVMSAQSVKGADMKNSKKEATVKSKKQVASTQQNAAPVKMVDANNKQANTEVRAKEEGKAVLEPTGRKKN
ncbi:hypothetical protein [Soonwooa sp.]|uniref:hypothetical protein n=1 Tax=Soonwooa sp. TaxID=1938592 RepID=UPI00260A0867|nr:hypothetical protein [Soonwooa sp.]